jgi:hypothetical protein
MLLMMTSLGLNSLKSISKPTTNINKIRPKLATMPSRGWEDFGKSVSEKPGMRPSTVGPKIMPASISATTIGSLILPIAKPKPLDKVVMIIIWTRRRDMAELKMYPPSKKVAVLGAATGAINGVVLFDMKKLRLMYNCGVEVILNRKKICGASCWNFLLFQKGGVPAEITI